MSERAKNSELVGFSELGARTGETHPRAKLSDEDVELIRQLREEYKIPLGVLAEKFDCSFSLIGQICRYRKRVTPAVVMRKKKVTNNSAGAKKTPTGDSPGSDGDDNE
jgi:hypothetical protein